MGRNRESLSRYLFRSLIAYTLALGIAIALVDSVFDYLVSTPPGKEPAVFHVILYLLSSVAIYAAFVIGFSRVMRRRIQLQNETLIKERLQLMADMGHDLRTPLTSIKGFSRALISGKLTQEEEKLQAAETIHRRSLEMERMLDELLDYARTVRQTPANALSPVRVNAFLRGVVAEHYAVFEEKGMALSCDLAADATLMLDAPRFRRAFENILLNALKHCPAGSQVQVKTEKARRRFKKTLRILIADSGPAISPAQQRQIFQPFVKLDESRNQTSGYGLGLSIAQAITAQAGGALKVEPMPPPYTKAFVMELPLVYNKSNTSKGTHDAAMA
jgi:signal transduction histidine kinase